MPPAPSRFHIKKVKQLDSDTVAIMALRRYHSDPTTGEFILLDLINGLWFPAFETMAEWQSGDIRIYKPIDMPDTLVTMPNCLFWPRLSPIEETKISFLIERPWIQDSHIHYISYDGQINIIDALEAPILVEAPQASHVPTSAYPAHIIDAILEHAETTKKTCPITMEPLQKTTATVTSCGHIFQKAALTEWLETHKTCPECRQTL